MDKAVVNGKTYILVPEEVYNETPEKPERARTGYERVERPGKYYLANFRDSKILYDRDGKGDADNDAYENGNYYNDEQLAKDNARADSILRRMRQWQALNDVAVERYNSAAKKYSIVWSVTAKEPVINHIITGCGVDNYEVYFSSFEKAQEALEVFRDDLIWLHTKYSRRLDEVRG